MSTRSYRPSNGTAGCIFDDLWCSRCARDAAWRADESAKPCDILSRTFFYSLGDRGYPTEWIEDDVPYPQDTNPQCTAFVEIGSEDSSYVKDDRQLELLL